MDISIHLSWSFDQKLLILQIKREISYLLCRSLSIKAKISFSAKNLEDYFWQTIKMQLVIKRSTVLNHSTKAPSPNSHNLKVSESQSLNKWRLIHFTKKVIIILNLAADLQVTQMAIAEKRTITAWLQSLIATSHHN